MTTEPTSLRLDIKTKAEAYAVLQEIGMKPSQAVNLFFRQVALQRGIPFDIKIPNAETLEAMEELENGGGYQTDSLEKFYNLLGIDDDGEE